MDIKALPPCSLNVRGHKMHYVTLGKGKPVIFIHGFPTSSYIWRNVMPKSALRHQCIALDLIGMGLSDKPDIDYSISDHVAYFEEFMEKLNLSSPAILVMHGWGSVIGLTYAMRHSEKIRGLAMIESYMNLSEEYGEVSASVNEMTRLALDDPEKLKYFVMEDNYLVEKIMPMLMSKKLSEQDFNVYRQPFEKKEHRKVLLRFAQEQPHRDISSPASELINAYTGWLQETSIPKLLMYAVPGFLTRMNNVIWALNHLSHLTLIEIGTDFHYLPESHGAKIEEVLSQWLLKSV